MKPDHEAAKKWAHDVWGTLKDIALHEVLETDAIDHRNVAACYLDAMAQLDKAEKERDEAMTLLREIEGPLARCDGELSAIHHRGTVDRDNCKNFSEAARALGVKIRAFLKETQ